MDDARCTGLDWDPLRGQNSRCWLMVRWYSHRTRHHRATHYDLNRACIGTIKLPFVLYVVCTQTYSAVQCQNTVTRFFAKNGF